MSTANLVQTYDYHEVYSRINMCYLQLKLTDLINNILKEGYIPDDWRNSILVPVYKGTGNPRVCGSYRTIKLLADEGA